MKTMGIQKDLRDMLSTISKDDETVDATINRILDLVEDGMNEDIDFTRSRRTNINISEDTYDRLVSYRVRENEPLMRVLKRAVVLFNQV